MHGDRVGVNPFTTGISKPWTVCVKMCFLSVHQTIINDLLCVEADVMCATKEPSANDRITENTNAKTVSLFAFGKNKEHFSIKAFGCSIFCSFFTLCFVFSSTTGATAILHSTYRQ